LIQSFRGSNPLTPATFLFNIPFLKLNQSLLKLILNIISVIFTCYLEYLQGYSQAVRQLVLIQSFRGSNPLTPATLLFKIPFLRSN
jgi:hypothetical protein